MSGFFDTFTGDEAARMEIIMAELKDESWAQPILRSIQDNGGLVGANMARFFELRQGYALNKAGIKLQHEISGEGGSTLDFGFTACKQAWAIELMRLEETQAVKAATTVTTYEDGATMAARILHSDAEDKHQTSEGETLKAVQRICQKCERDGKPYKFPLPGKAFHAIIVDFRTFHNGGDDDDRLHVALGGVAVKERARMYWGEGKERRLISGVFNEETKVKGAVYARERVHFIGFVSEKTFAPTEFARVSNFVANPHLFADQAAADAAFATWPLK